MRLPFPGTCKIQNRKSLLITVHSTGVIPLLGREGRGREAPPKRRARRRGGYGVDDVELELRLVTPGREDGRMRKVVGRCYLCGGVGGRWRSAMAIGQRGGRTWVSWRRGILFFAPLYFVTLSFALFYLVLYCLPLFSLPFDDLPFYINKEFVYSLLRI
jgi:hypothetical protein